jgi:hypothetical protein
LRALLAEDRAAGKRVEWVRTSDRTATVEVDVGRAVTATIVRLEEAIERGQVVARYTLSGSEGEGWRVLSQGTTIGYARLERFARNTCARARDGLVQRWLRPQSAAATVKGNRRTGEQEGGGREFLCPPFLLISC